MEWYIVCFVDNDGCLRAVSCKETATKLPLYIHLDKCINRKMESVLSIHLVESEIFHFEGNMFKALTIANKTGRGKIVVISDAFFTAPLFQSVFNQLNLGIQIFDSHGRLRFLNSTDEKMELLIKENVIGRHLRDIYEVDEQYSTVLTTLKNREPVENRCDIFANRVGDKLLSINCGYPLFVENHFAGVLGVTMDQRLLADYCKKKEILQKYLDNKLTGAIDGYHINRYYCFSDIIGDSKAIKNTVHIAGKVAPGDFSVLLLGETGTGKEMFAQSIHSHSGRRDKQFVAINCAAIPASILESTLFGTVKGAFTGSGNQKGLLDEANGGTLFLDEINSMDIGIQAKLLRVLQEKSFRRVGGLASIHCNFRVIAAMNEPPGRAIAQNRLREDLYYRLGAVSIEIPPLRDRAEDIPMLAEHYLRRLSRTNDKGITGISAGALAALQGYNWPGNVRELFHALEHAFAISETNTIEINVFPQRLLLKQEPVEQKRQENLHPGDLNQRLREYEREIIEGALRENGCNISKAAKSLNLSRQSLQHRIKKCNIHLSTQLKPQD